MTVQVPISTGPTRYLFEKARIAWRENGGVVNGFDPEYDNLVKVCRTYRLKISEVVPLLLPGVEAYFAYCERRKADKVFCESPSSFTVFTNNRRWLREYPQTSKPKRTKCGKCGKLSTHSICVYYKDGARNSYRCDNCPDPEPDWRKRAKSK